MNKLLKMTAVLLLGFINVNAQVKDNPELQQMFDEDQRSRSVPVIDWKVVSKQDSLRRKRVTELMWQNNVVTGKDHYNAAMIFQHGPDTAASAMAVNLMKVAITLDSGINKWLLAAAIDRDLMRRNKPQIYGTQYTRNKNTGKWARYKIDSLQVSDEERRLYRVETLAEQREKERKMNLLSISRYHIQEKSVDKTIALIEKEMKRETKAEYNVDEVEINTLGYEILNGGNKNDALKIFELNTRLYPLGFNTYDSYGECLMLLGKKDEALRAYKKSLELNPGNANARKVLESAK